MNKYELIVDGKSTGEYTAHEITDMIGVERRTIYDYSKNGYVWNDRYQFAVTQQNRKASMRQDSFPQRWNEVVEALRCHSSEEELLREWDAVTRKLRRKSWLWKENN